MEKNMRRTSFQKMVLFIFAIGLIPVMPAMGQLSLDLDIASRYVWRGFDFGDSPSIQPELSYTIGGLEVGTWAAIATNGDPAGYEVDWFASYTVETDAGDLGFMLTDYTFPVPGMGDYLSSDAHFVEAGVEYSGIGGTPFSLFGGMFIHGDDDNSVYLEMAYDAEPVGFFIGMTPGESAEYGTTGAEIINLGITTGKTVDISEGLSVDLTYDVILNPHAEDLFFLVTLSF